LAAPWCRLSHGWAPPTASFRVQIAIAGPCRTKARKHWVCRKPHRLTNAQPSTGTVGGIGSMPDAPAPNAPVSTASTVRFGAGHRRRRPFSDIFLPPQHEAAGARARELAQACCNVLAPASLGFGRQQHNRLDDLGLSPVGVVGDWISGCDGGKHPVKARVRRSGRPQERSTELQTWAKKANLARWPNSLNSHFARCRCKTNARSARLRSGETQIAPDHAY
jgi:hypothetical protein